MTDSRGAKSLLARLDRIEDLLRSPDVPGQVQQAKDAALSIARGAPSGVVAELALQVVAALGAVNQFPQMAAYMLTLDVALRNLRQALLGTGQDKGE